MVEECGAGGTAGTTQAADSSSGTRDSQNYETSAVLRTELGTDNRRQDTAVEADRSWADTVVGYCMPQ